MSHLLLHRRRLTQYRNLVRNRATSITDSAEQARKSFADFPRLCRAVAENRYLPYPFRLRGRRLVYSYGIYALVLLSGVLLIAFGGITDRLIPLFAVGAFLAFALSQAGMVMHWKRTGGWHTRASMLINGVGAIST
jgi:hypothetical protein